MLAQWAHADISEVLQTLCGFAATVPDLHVAGQGVWLGGLSHWGRGTNELEAAPPVVQLR